MKKGCSGNLFSDISLLIIDYALQIVVSALTITRHIDNNLPVTSSETSSFGKDQLEFWSGSSGN